MGKLANCPHGSPDDMPCAHPTCPAGTAAFEWCVVTGADKKTLSVYSRSVLRRGTKDEGFVWELSGHR